MTHQAMYQSLKEQQKCEQKESDLLIINNSKAYNAGCIEPYSLFLIMMGYDPWFIGKAQGIAGAPNLSFYPANMEKNDHLMLVKCKNTLSEKRTKFIIKRLVQVLPYQELNKFVLKLQKRVATHPSSAYAEIRSLRINQNNAKQIGKKALEIWFSKRIMGSYLLVRVLSVNKLHHKFPSLALANEITSSIIGLGKNKCDGDKFWEFNPRYIIMTDSRMYSLTQEESDKLNYPTKVNTDFVEISESGQCVNGVTEHWFGLIDKWNINRNSTDFRYQYSMTICEEFKTKKKRLKILYGEKVFEGYVSGLRALANSTRFVEWAYQNKLELWCGRDETVKIQDYRLLKRRIKRMEQENKKLREQLLHSQSNSSSSSSSSS